MTLRDQCDMSRTNKEHNCPSRWLLRVCPQVYENRYPLLVFGLFCDIWIEAQYSQMCVLEDVRTVLCSASGQDSLRA